jgi:hypothetical protein
VNAILDDIKDVTSTVKKEPGLRTPSPIGTRVAARRDARMTIADVKWLT